MCAGGHRHLVVLVAVEILSVHWSVPASFHLQTNYSVLSAAENCFGVPDPAALDCSVADY